MSTAMNRRTFLKKTTAAATLLRSGSAQARTDAPNIVFILGDNYSWLHLHPYGCQAIDSPNFDRIAG